ncbi:substrate-binding domain-containing protein [Halovulum dunhuangense]|uniref:Substrate-binding domain-containing protein n=1 Tax=Halovulum dunhuangense TaxID=1505036 RepID=A0A849L676_9RHOB|nr:substrate-binding domain-containing protein [Halovulum dunhuangense]NNU81743.1 substrate-binding domain-containing protein [Halovulum dunhuangense]
MTTTEPLKVITSGAFAAALVKLLPHYKAPDGTEVDVSFGSSLGAAHDSIPTRLSKGERFDVYLLAEAAVAQFSEQGHIRPDSRIDLVESHIGACVREGDPAPDISTTEAFRETLLAAKSVGHAASASGIYLSTEVFPALGIAEQMKKTAFTVFSERVGTIVARGEADLGFQQISEILPIPGVKLIGRLPPEFRRPFHFCAGIGAGTDKLDRARHLLRFLASEEAGPIIRETGLDPLFPEVR